MTGWRVMRQSHLRTEHCDSVDHGSSSNVQEGFAAFQEAPKRHIKKILKEVGTMVQTGTHFVG